MQGLARLKLLSRFDYLSTVSGGGYIGSWLWAWISRRSLREVTEGLIPERAGHADKSETHEVGFLRNYSNYLTPRRGIFGADTWTAIATYVRNLTLILTILVSALLGLLIAPKILVALHGMATERADLSFLAITMFLLSLAIATVVSNLSSLFSEPDPSLGRQGQAAVIYIGAVLPALAGAWFLSTWLWAESRTPIEELWATGLSEGSTWGEAWFWAVGGAAAYVLMWIFGLFIRKKAKPAASESRPASDFGPTEAPDRSWPERSLRRAARYGRVLVNTIERSAASFRVVTWAAVFSGALGGVGLLYVRQHLSTIQGIAAESSVAVWGMPLIMAVFVLTGTLHIGLSGKGFEDEAREWWGRLGALLFLGTLGVFGATALVEYGPRLLDGVLKDASGWVEGGIFSGWLGTTVAGVLAGKSPRKSNRVFKAVGAIAPYVFVAGLLLLLVRLADAITPVEASVGTMALILLSLFAVGLVLSWRIGVNEFSMHAFYRNRLVRCYLGASNDRNAHPFTGFDPTDDIDSMEKLITDRFDGPYPIINTALNLVAGEELAWQQRKAASFIFTPKYSGYDAGLRTERSPDSKLDPNGYRPTAAYGGGIRLGTAMAISGAAASPNMGYHTSTALAFLMTVFNVRLGWWLPNTRRDSWRSHSPIVGIFYLLYELLGMTNQKRRYVYLSDGGHFENLGVYELVKRRCKVIVACDASEDHDMTFASLGNAIEKCRTDLGIDIVVDVGEIRQRDSDGRSHVHFKVGHIRYDQVDKGASQGTFIYIKSSLKESVPTDVLRYRDRNKDFPHQSTADQWFGESQFESYRELGRHIAEDVFRDVRDPSSTSLVAKAFENR